MRSLQPLWLNCAMASPASQARFLLIIPSKTALLHLMAIPPCPVTPGLHPKPLSSSLKAPLGAGMGSKISLSLLVPRLNSSSSLSLAPEQRGSSPANVHGDTAGLHGTKGSLSHCGTTETLVTLGCPMETRGHCDTAEPHGTKDTLVTL